MLLEVSSLDAFQSRPVISENNIVWQDNRNGNNNIYLYNILSDSETRLTDGSDGVDQPAIDGNRIVWRNITEGEIYLYELPDEPAKNTSNDTEFQSKAVISDNKVLWRSRSKLFVHELTTGQTMKVPNNGGSIDFFNFAISGDLITWVELDRSTSTRNIFIFKLGSGDTISPEITYNVHNTALWPPNHEIRLAIKGITATDNVDPDPEVTITVSSNESSNGKGDGNTIQDWKVVQESDGSYSVYLRAERSGQGAGRIYTVDITAPDEADNTVSEQVQFIVAHDKRKL